MATIWWEGLEGYVDRKIMFRVGESTNGWRVYLRGDPLDRIDYPSEEAAKAAAEAVVDEVPVVPAPPRGRRARRPEEYPGRPPHPGTLRRPPKI